MAGIEGDAVAGTPDSTDPMDWVAYYVTVICILVEHMECD